MCAREIKYANCREEYDFVTTSKPSEIREFLNNKNTNLFSLLFSSSLLTTFPLLPSSSFCLYFQLFFLSFSFSIFSIIFKAIALKIMCQELKRQEDFYPKISAEFKLRHVISGWDGKVFQLWIRCCLAWVRHVWNCSLQPFQSPTEHAYAGFLLHTRIPSPDVGYLKDRPTTQGLGSGSDCVFRWTQIRISVWKAAPKPSLSCHLSWIIGWIMSLSV